MPITLNETHDPNLRSWAGDSDDFPIQNLPIAVFRPSESDETFRGGIAIGENVLDLAAVAGLKIFNGLAQSGLVAAAKSELNEYMAMGIQAWSTLRLELSRALQEGSPFEQALSSCLYSLEDVEYSLPCRIGDYTDFYTSVYHATAVGKQFRPDNPLLPNYKWIPIGYHGRSSSIGISPQSFVRPCGQLKAPDDETPHVGSCKRLDYELELGIYIGSGNELGTSIGMASAEDHVFGLCLFNDWSARDIQGWEYQPLGPFLAKSFASTVSPWIISLEALAPYRLSWERPSSDPQPLDYLQTAENAASGAIDIQLEAYILSSKMAGENQQPMKLSQASFQHSYWTIAQLVAHHSMNGCNLNPGDLFGSGTQSGPLPAEAGSMLELSGAGKNPLTLPTGEKRGFLEDGDTIIFKGS
ncbi:MAG: fumarylacetoacetase, partial [Gammaproteobacteria bacterium]|nr:fumarylacetoacetase [Gammaproteobacteria bacterium]